MVAIADSTIRQNVFETLYDAINGITFSGAGTVTVTAAYIDNSQALPQVVINPVDVDYTDFSMGSSPKFAKEMRVLVDIYTRKNKDKDVIADQIMNTLMTNKYTGMNIVGLSESNAFETPGLGSKIHLKSLALTIIRGA